MIKRTIAVAGIVGLVATAFAAAPVRAQEAEAPPIVVPEEPNIVDPPGDANYLNGQGGSDERDHVTPADAGTISDIIAGWLTNDKSSITAYIQTEGPWPATPAYFIRFRVDPGGAGETCLWLQIATEGVGNPGEAAGSMRDTCGENDETTTEGIEVAFGEADGTGIAMVTIPRAAHPAFATGSVLATPDIHIRNYLGVVTAPQIDDTAPGADYTVTAGGEAEKPKKPKAKKSAGKGKKRGQVKKGKKSPAKKCAAFEPGEAGAEAETVTVTDGATEEKPVEATVELGQSAADLTFGGTDASYAYLNLQVDTVAPDAGLYVLIEFPERNDHDLNLLHTDGSYAARSRAWNTFIELNDGPVPISATGHGGESTSSSEKLVGIRTADCGGWTLEVANYLGFGGEQPVKIWLGEAANDPQAPGEETP